VAPDTAYVVIVGVRITGSAHDGGGIGPACRGQPVSNARVVAATRIRIRWPYPVDPVARERPACHDDPMYGEDTRPSARPEGPAPGIRETVLVVEGEELPRHRVKNALRTDDRDVFVASTARDGFNALRQVEPVVIFVSLDLPDIAGVRVIDAFRDSAPHVPVIALSPRPSVAEAVEAVRHGAVDYVGHDEPRPRLVDAATRAIAEGRTSKQLEKIREQVRDRYGVSHMLTQSPRMLDVFDQIRAVATTDATVLILGETGSGKELVSRAIHERSRRKENPFIAVNCGAFAETLLESELFGHERGSFTGAQARREGLFEMADRGTLFLDELGETSLNVQVNLLRVLEEMEFRRVGGRESVHVDVRIVAATNVDLTNAVAEGRFRADLFYRLNVFPIRLPPLRERREDIPLLMRHFLDEFGQQYELEPPIVSSEAMHAILDYPWRGNVRQLRAMCERWVIIRPGQRLEPQHLPPDMTGAPDPTAGVSLNIDEFRSLKENLERINIQVERSYLFALLRRTQGAIDQSAEEAGISRRTLYTKMKQYGLEAADFRGN
jgi:two-component system response regulator AtoC